MIELTCWGCGCTGKAPDDLAGRRVICKKCRTVNLIPANTTQEIDVKDWIKGIDPESEEKTKEVDVKNWPHMKT